MQGRLSIWEKKIPHMTLILFKCVPAVRQDFINIFSTSCLQNIIARFSWQVPFTSHIPELKRVPCHVGLSFLSPDTNKMSNAKCSVFRIHIQKMCFSKVRASTHLTLHSWARMFPTGNLQREAVIGRRVKAGNLIFLKKSHLLAGRRRNSCQGRQLPGTGGLLVTD